MAGVRKAYDGPLTIARDLMEINVTKEDIVVGMATVDEYVLPPDVIEAYKKAPRSDDISAVREGHERKMGWLHAATDSKEDK